MAAGLVAAPIAHWIDERTRWPLLSFGLEGARAVSSALSTSLLTFIVFAFSILLLVAQTASAQLTPRILRRVVENRIARRSLGAMTFAWTFSLAALSRIETRVPQLPVALAIFFSLCCVALFLYLVQFTIRSMRPVSMLMIAGRETRAAIDARYPRLYSEVPSRQEERAAEAKWDAPSTTSRIKYPGPCGTVQALDLARLAAIAQETHCAIRVLPSVGDFIATDGPLFEVEGALAGAIGKQSILDCVVVGTERVVAHDPAFGFRIIVDIASKALSPAINDPTTAVLAVDQLHELLRYLGARQLDAPLPRDASGRVLLTYRGPSWEDFVLLAVTEIRLYGAQSIQVTRRLQAMFEDLARELPTDRRAAVFKQQLILHASIGRDFGDIEDRALAGSADLQGLGSGQTLITTGTETPQARPQRVS